MYRCYRIEPKIGVAGTLYNYVVYRVAMGGRGQSEAIWRESQRSGGYSTAEYARSRCKQHFPGLPCITADHGRKVTWRQAERLTGVCGPPALDYLTENWDTGTNWVKPKPVKEAKPEPTADELLAAEVKRCREMCEMWEEKSAHANRRATKWAKKANRLEAKRRKAQSTS